MLLVPATRAVSGDAGLHDRWNALLARHVDNGRVDYEGIRRERAELDGYLTALRAAAPPIAHAGRDEQTAYWINVYNAYTIALVLDHWPLESIWNVTPLWKRPFGGPFALDYIPLGTAAPELGKAKLSLNDIEHEILRKRLTDPRIHFALVCASRGCPPLASAAYTAGRLDAQLNLAARTFLADAGKNRFDAGRKVLVLSPIFRWYAGDFAALGGPEGVFRRYGPAEETGALGDGAPAVEYSEYDWSLNSRTGAGKPDNSPGPGGAAGTGPPDSRGMLKEK